MTRNRLLLWAVLILLATNLATILSALRYSGRVKAEERTKNETIADSRVLFFRNHLNLTDSQMVEFVRLNRDFVQEARKSTSRLDLLRREMVENLSERTPDHGKIESLTDEIGGLHRDLKRTTASFYLGLKDVCSPEQQHILKEMFLVMSDPEGDIVQFRRGPMGQGPGQAGKGMNRRGSGRGMGNRF